jgi:hypothetical protein
VGVGGLMVVWLEIEARVIGKAALKKGADKRGRGRGVGAAGFCGPCVCLGVFFML